MARKPRAKKTETAVSGILNAVKFCEPASREVGQPNQTHIRLANHWAVASDGVVSMGCMIDTDLDACPHTHTLIAALSKCTDATQITQLGDNRLSVKSGRFAAMVPCLQSDLLAPAMPDPPCANVTPAVFNSLRIVGPIAQENAQRIMLASVMLRSGSAVATNGRIVIEHWHGVDLPPVLLPKAFITIISKIEKPPIYFGFTAGKSATFYFDDKSWIKSQLYAESWPDVDRVLNTPFNAWPIPGGLKDALDKICDLTDIDEFFTSPRAVRTHYSVEQGASCEIEGGLPDGLSLNLENVQLVLSHATIADFQAGEHKDRAVFQGANFRAVLSHNKMPPQP